MLFSFAEFENELTRFSASVGDRYIPDFFAHNRYASQLHIRIAESPNYLSRTIETTLISYFFHIFAAVEQYIHASIADISEIRGKSPKTSNDILEKFAAIVADISATNLIGNQIAMTMTYLRQRRNCYAHNAGIASRQLLATISTSGANLNQYWQNKPRAISGLDFTATDIATLSPVEAIAVYSLARVCLSECEASIVSRFNEELIKLQESRIASDPTYNLSTNPYYDRLGHLKRIVSDSLGLTDAEVDAYTPSVN